MYCLLSTDIILVSIQLQCRGFRLYSPDTTQIFPRTSFKDLHIEPIPHAMGSCRYSSKTSHADTLLCIVLYLTIGLLPWTQALIPLIRTTDYEVNYISPFLAYIYIYICNGVFLNFSSFYFRWFSLNLLHLLRIEWRRAPGCFQRLSLRLFFFYWNFISLYCPNQVCMGIVVLETIERDRQAVT